MITNIVITGVGGQGTILISHILAEAAHLSGMKVYVGEVHGMSQRGGSVLSYVRIGDAHSSLVPAGEAHVVLGLEVGETYRAHGFMNSNTRVFTSNRTIVPLTAIKGEHPYPPVDTILSAIKEHTPHIQVIDAPGLARKSGSEIAENTVLLGALLGSSVLPISREAAEEAMEKRMKAHLLPLNMKAFNEGFQAGV